MRGPHQIDPSPGHLSGAAPEARAPEVERDDGRMGTALRVGAFTGSDLDDELTVLRDACVDADDEVHRVLLDEVFPRQATVTTTAEWVAELARP